MTTMFRTLIQSFDRRWTNSVDEYGEVVSIEIGPVRFEIRPLMPTCKDRGRFEMFCIINKRYKPTDSLKSVITGTPIDSRLLIGNPKLEINSGSRYFKLDAALADAQNWLMVAGFDVDKLVERLYPMEPTPEQTQTLINEDYHQFVKNGEGFDNGELKTFTLMKTHGREFSDDAGSVVVEITRSRLSWGSARYDKALSWSVDIRESVEQLECGEPMLDDKDGFPRAYSSLLVARMEVNQWLINRDIIV